MSAHDIPVKCTRCRHQCMMSEWPKERFDKSIPGANVAICPKCRCHSYYDMRAYRAWVWSSGLIEMGSPAEASIQVSKGAIPFATGPKSSLEAEVKTVARHGKGASAGALLFPGIPEAANQETAFVALEEFVKWRNKARSRNKDVCWSITAERKEAA